MKTKIYLTLFLILMSVQILQAQQVIYGDKNKANSQYYQNVENETSNLNYDAIYYQADQDIPSTFTSDNNTLVVCRLVHEGDNSGVLCSTDKPEKGWGKMVSTENDNFIYEENSHKTGADIYSIAFTDPKNGWAVGIMDSYSVSSGVIFNTKDGGKTWKLQFISGTGMVLQSVGFTDTKRGWVTGVRNIGNVNYEIMLATSDAGETWNEQNLAMLKGSNPY